MRGAPIEPKTSLPGVVDTPKPTADYILYKEPFMEPNPDPFSHHPSLRDEIADPLQSFMRTFTTATLAAKTKELGLTQNV